MIRALSTLSVYKWHCYESNMMYDSLIWQHWETVLVAFYQLKPTKILKWDDKGILDFLCTISLWWRLFRFLKNLYKDWEIPRSFPTDCVQSMHSFLRFGNVSAKANKSSLKQLLWSNSGLPWHKLLLHFKVFPPVSIRGINIWVPFKRSIVSHLSSAHAQLSILKIYMTTEKKNFSCGRKKNKGWQEDLRGSSSLL